MSNYKTKLTYLTSSIRNRNQQKRDHGQNEKKSDSSPPVPEHYHHPPAPYPPFERCGKALTSRLPCNHVAKGLAVSNQLASSLVNIKKHLQQVHRW